MKYIDCEKRNNMQKKLPLPVLVRLSALYDYLTKMRRAGVLRVSSAELGAVLGQSSHTIRKDISFLGVAGTAGAKYDTGDLQTLVGKHLGFEQIRNCCIIGLGRLGSALMEHFATYESGEFRVVAGFESNINRLETLQSPIPLYPAYRIEEMLSRIQVELAMIAVPPEQAQEVTDRCCDGGIAGIINFTPVVIRPKNDSVVVRSIDISGELRVLSALLHTSTATVNKPSEKE
jgi:redox-sensing transcriptional repressor